MGLARALAVSLVVLLSVFVASDCADAEPFTVLASHMSVTEERADWPEQDDCPARGDGDVQLVVRGSSSAPSASQSSSRSGCGADGACEECGCQDTITAPRTARDAVPLTRSGELPIAFQVFRC
jgi:hypothetical protein